MGAIGREGGDELARAALGIPVAVGIRPGAAGRRVLVVGDGVGHAAVEQQAFDAMALPRAAGVGRRAVEGEAAVGDGDGGGHGDNDSSPVTRGRVVRGRASLTLSASSRSKEFGISFVAFPLLYPPPY